LFKKNIANKKKNRFTELPWIKYSSILGGAVVLFMSSCFLLSYFLFSLSSEDSLMPSKNADIKPGDILSKNLKVELDPFIIPLSGTENVNSFLRITIQLNTQKGYDNKIREETKNIRLVIYNLLSHKKPRDILDFKKLDMIKAELQNILNSILENKIITGVSLMDVLLI
jgi:flagellar basal body-associated protein FliL